MNAADIQSRFEFACRLIEEAGELASGYFNRLSSLTIKSKGVQDMASEADLNTELLIRERLKAAFPEDAFFGEETGRTEVNGAPGVWVVDPIDGTQPFISGMSSWCVSIAFVADGKLEMGFVASPARRETFVGQCGRWSTLNGARIQVRQASKLTDGIVGVGYSPRVKPDEFLPMFGRLLHAGGTFYREGSGALTLCSVAAGRLIGYVEPHINSYDCLGALAVIDGAGGKISDFLANEGLWKGNRVIAGSADIYPVLESLFGEGE
jgi:myo-inositol-1(or 4)-monophosphatase